ncbi:hypothetical protein F511_18224 [Dorcoceras hygrometricum]|uniref:Uncharacterized protein n=1 Tax=Dorcoceras hygrometricum TaxID=472368 RepID=A0A2Z7BFY6_9LAMI|nr:hypothetical protein F511_18224 [Dorcoceras hygrometricum]
MIGVTIGYSAQCVEHEKRISGRLDDLKNCFSHHDIQFWKLSRSVRSDRRSELR